MEISRVPVIIFIICLIAAGITYLLGRFAKGRRVYKYIPFVISIIAGSGLYIKSAFFSRSFEDIGYLILAMAAGIFAIASVVTAIIMDILRRNKN